MFRGRTFVSRARQQNPIHRASSLCMNIKIVPWFWGPLNMIWTTLLDVMKSSGISMPPLKCCIMQNVNSPLKIRAYTETKIRREYRAWYWTVNSTEIFEHLKKKIDCPDVFCQYLGRRLSLPGGVAGPPAVRLYGTHGADHECEKGSYCVYNTWMGAQGARYYKYLLQTENIQIFLV